MKFVVKALKQSGSNNTSPQQSPQTLQPKQSFTTVPLTSPLQDDSLEIKPEQIQGYEKFFMNLTKGASSVPGKVAVEFFLQSNVQPQILKQIW